MTTKEIAIALLHEYHIKEYPPPAASNRYSPSPRAVRSSRSAEPLLTECSTDPTKILSSAQKLDLSTFLPPVSYAREPLELPSVGQAIRSRQSVTFVHPAVDQNIQPKHERK